MNNFSSIDPPEKPRTQDRIEAKNLIGITRGVFFNAILLGFLCTGLFLLGCATAPAQITERSGDRELAELLESVRVEERLPALTAAVILDGKIYATAAVGTRKIGTENWVSVDDKFIIGSCGKAFTATLAAVLVEEGRLSWHTTIKDVFPDLKMLPEYENITIQQLLSHRAGLPKNFIADLDENRTYTPTSGRLIYLEQLVQNHLINPPEKIMLYSNAGYTLAGVMLEKITGQTFPDLMAEKVFLPLNLNTAGYGAPADLEPLSQPWGHISNKLSLVAVRRDYPHWLDPAGATISLSIKDWAKFIVAHMYLDQDTSRTLLTSKTLKKLHTPPNAATWDYNGLYFAFWHKHIGWPLTSSNYALGWFRVKTKEGENVLTHGGTSKSFMAEVYLSADKKSAILLATNARTSHMPLYRGAKRIKEHYSLKISLP
ncbi:MAG: beta-lactamase family protein [Deltaproteobacteria bacterium]|nr:MAG: beta-lactamase family protein [Deltaproteobacteria bacterium]